MLIFDHPGPSKYEKKNKNNGCIGLFVCILRFFVSLNACWASKLAPSWLRLAYLSVFGPRLTQVGSKLAPVGSKLGPSWLQVGSSWTHVCTKLAQVGPLLGPHPGPQPPLDQPKPFQTPSLLPLGHPNPYKTQNGLQNSFPSFQLGS